MSFWSQRDIWTRSEQYTLTSFFAEFLASYTLSIILNIGLYTAFVLFHSYARWSVARLSIAQLIIAAINCRRG